jgi:hypothetical protein
VNVNYFPMKELEPMLDQLSDLLTHWAKCVACCPQYILVRFICYSSVDPTTPTESEQHALLVQLLLVSPCAADGCMLGFVSAQGVE